ncbi:MAG: AmmeMemoRadiSam system protein B [Nanoarchaeota archaeon]
MNRKTCDYELGFDKINKLIDHGFNSSIGPGVMPIEARKNKLRGIIAPNFLKESSSAAFAWAYKEIAEAKMPETYVIIGRDFNAGNKFSTFLFSDWDTCIGSAKVDVLLGRKLIAGCPLLKNSFEAFNGNSFIDVHLPFLQYANRNNLDRLRFLPILVGNVTYDEICDFADVISDCSNICVVASAGLSYYGKEFDFMPFVHAVKQNLTAIDHELLSFIKEVDVGKIMNTALKRGAFDLNVIIFFMEIMKGFGLRKGKVLSYYNSGDFDGYDNAVGLGAVAF